MKPNIIYVITDQFRRQAMGFWSNSEYSRYIRGGSDPVHTPQLDKFAKESVVFTQAVSNCPLCSPYRGMLFSGRYPENNGVLQNCRAGRESALKEEVTCLTDILAQEGYNLGYIGKLHLDMPKTHFDERGNYVGEVGEYYVDGSQLGDISCWDMITPAGPRRHSIDYWYSYGTFDQHHNPHYWDNDCLKHEPKEWSPKHEADVAIDYIKNSNGQRDLEKPFCLLISMNPPHDPHRTLRDTNEEMYYKYYSPEMVPEVGDLLTRPNRQGSIADEHVRYYYSHISGVDKQFGRILDAIENQGYKENTIVIFSADHGEMLGSHGLMGKNIAYDESMLIPLLIRYPRRMQHRIENMMISGPDMMPSLLGLSGLGDKIPEDLDGVDYSDIIIHGESSTQNKPKSALYLFKSEEIERKGVRTDTYTFVLEKRKGQGIKKYMLFNNETDVYQVNNLDELEASEEELLMRELSYWLKKANDSWYRQGLL